MNHGLVVKAEQHLKAQYAWVQAAYIEPAKESLIQKRQQYADELAAEKGVSVGLKFKLPVIYFWDNDSLFVPPHTVHMNAEVTAIRYLDSDDCMVFFLAKDGNRSRPEEYYNLSLFVKFLKSE